MRNSATCARNLALVSSSSRIRARQSSTVAGTLGSASSNSTPASSSFRQASRARQFNERCGMENSNRSGSTMLLATFTRAPVFDNCATVHSTESAPSPKDIRAGRNVLLRLSERLSLSGLLVCVELIVEPQALHGAPVAQTLIALETYQ